MPYKPYTLSAKVVIRDSEDRCLLLKRSMSSKGNPGKWDLPGGKVDTKESLEQALLREVAEEIGLKISLQRVLGAAESESPTKRVAYIIFEGHLLSGEVHLSDEHDDFMWIGCENLGTSDMAEQFRPLLREYNLRDNKP